MRYRGLPFTDTILKQLSGQNTLDNKVNQTKSSDFDVLGSSSLTLIVSRQLYDDTHV